MHNQQILKYFPWLNAEQEQELQHLLWQRAAHSFEMAGLWRNAADCWAQAGDTAHASDLYVRSGNQRHAALLLLERGEYAAALKLYEAWGASLLSGDVTGRMEALLGQAACHLLGAQVRAGGLNRTSGLAAYHQARQLAEQDQTARVWLLLAQYGERVGRYDLVESSCERGLALTHLDEERVEMLLVYLHAAQRAGDRTQTQRLTEQLADLGMYYDDSDSVPDIEPENIPMFQKLKEDLISRAGQWIQKFGVDTLSNHAPEQFAHYFIALRGTKSYGRGAILIGNHWSPRTNGALWRVVHGWYDPQIQDRICWARHDQVAYLSPQWKPHYAQLSKYIHGFAGKRGRRFIRHTD